MIKFNLEPVEMWVGADAPIFDNTEFGNYPIEERKKLRFLLKTIPEETNQKLREKCRRKKLQIDFDQYKGLSSADKIWFMRTLAQLEDPVDLDKFIMERLVEGVLEWEGVLDAGGSPIACDSDNKRKVFVKIPIVANTLNGVLTELSGDLDLLQEKLVRDSEKNLPSTPSGTEDTGKK